MRLAVSAAVLGWVVTRVPWTEAAATARELRVAPLLAAVVAIVAGQLLRAVRTCALLRAGVRLADLPAMLRMQMLAFLPGLFSPAKAGELVKVEFLRREWGVSVARGTGAFLAERLADVGVLGLWATWGVVAVFGRAMPRLVPLTAAAALAGCGGAYWLWRTDRVPPAWRDRVRRALADVRWGPALGASVAYWGLVVGIVWLFARSAGSAASYAALAGAVPLSLLTALLPVSFGGFGVREGAMVVLFTHPAVGCTKAEAVAVGLLYDALGLGVPALMGAAYMLGGRRHA